MNQFNDYLQDYFVVNEYKIKKCKINDRINIDQYMYFLLKKCEKTMIHKKNIEKVDPLNVIIPTINSYSILNDYKYNNQQLKDIAKIYKIKTSGNKNELLTRIYMHLKLSYSIIKIQKIFRGYLQKKLNYYHGPALFDKNLCNNNTDFFTMDPLDDLNYSQFFSYKDVDNFIYGFNVISLHNLILKASERNRPIQNPYNRNDIPPLVVSNIKSLIRVSNLLNIPVNIEIDDIKIDSPAEKPLQTRILELFQNIDSLGNYSNSDWFLSLDQRKLIRFGRELNDIWMYRAQIPIEIKRNICPPHGDPYQGFDFYILISDHITTEFIQKKMIELMEKFVNSGVDSDSRALGAFYVLGALTLVNTDAANSLPWLFSSFTTQ
jgi:hypothetical protein